jgi:hypothetical protein
MTAMTSCTPRFDATFRPASQCVVAFVGSRASSAVVDQLVVPTLVPTPRALAGGTTLGLPLVSVYSTMPRALQSHLKPSVPINPLGFGVIP